jgi:T-complex protein 1 subunit gamma
VIVQAYFHALEKMMEFTDSLATPVDVDDPEIMSKVMNSCIGTKFSSRWGDLIERLAIQAVRTVKRDQKGILDIDVKRYAKIEKIPGGDISECRVLNGTMLNKDVTHG